jgi:uncharacterized protein (TIGR02246 family)
MKSKPFFAFGFLMVVSLSPLTIGCGPATPQVVQPPDTRDADEAAIRALTKQWSDAEADKDLPKCLSFYGEDGERMSSGSPLMTGQEDLRREWEKILAQPGRTSWMPLKIEVARSGDIAYETGISETKSLDPKNQAVIATGKYVHVWEKQDDGKWKVVEDIDSPDK